MLGRFSVPACFFAFQAGDSGKNGRMRIKGMAGITPEINVVRDAIDVIDVRHSHQSSVISRQS